MRLNLRGCLISERIVKSAGEKTMPDGTKKISSGRIYVSPEWINKTVIVVLKDGQYI